MNAQTISPEIDLNKPSQARVLARLGCIFIGIFFLLAISIFMIFERWYKPYLAKQFVEKTQAQFKELDTTKLEEDSSKIESYFDIINVGGLNDENLNQSLRLAQDIKQETDEDLKKFPSGNFVTKDIHKDVKNNLTNVNQLADHYVKDINLIIEIKKISDKSDEISDELNTAKLKADEESEFIELSSLYKSKAAEIDQFYNDLSNYPSSTSQTEQGKQIVLSYLKALKDYYAQTGDAWVILAKAYQENSIQLIADAGNSANEAKSKYKTEESKFVEDTKKFNDTAKKIANEYKTRFSQIKDEKLKINSKYDQFKSKYDI